MKTKVLKLYKVGFNTSSGLGQTITYYACKNFIELANAIRDCNIASIEDLGDVYVTTDENK